MKQRILIFTDFYAPGYKAGGGLRTLVNMVERFSDEFEFWIVTRNHDGWGDFTPYETVKSNEWNDLGDAKVFYFSDKTLSASKLKSLWREVEPEAVYLNSFFSSLTVRILALRRIKAAPKTPLIIAPEGELSKSALAIKSKKKKALVTLAQTAKLTRNVIWKAAAEPEKLNIQRLFGEKRKVFIAPNMPPKTILSDYSHAMKPEKRAGSLKILFLSRINRIKNLSFALSLLSQIQGEIHFDVLGKNDDEIYGRECQKLISQMPANVKVTVKDAVEYEQVPKTMSEYHFFILPTLGENFGHVIIEALAAGSPVIISDQTPWRDLAEKNVGWDISLDDEEKWLEILRKCVEMNDDEFSQMAQNSRDFALNWLAAPEVESVNRQVLRFAIANGNS